MRELDANTLMFFDQHMDALPLYQAFEELLFNSFPLVNKRVQKTQITFLKKQFQNGRMTESLLQSIRWVLIRNISLMEFIISIEFWGQRKDL